jgi:hypothetical protein
MNRRLFLRRVTAATVPLLAVRTFGRGLPTRGVTRDKELRSAIVIVGGSLGGVAAALAAARRGHSVILTEESDWIGGQATTQGVPLDEHPWIDAYGCPESYREFRRKVRDYYRRNYPLVAAAHRDPRLNPGAGWASPLHFEPRVGMQVLREMLAPHLGAGRVRLLTRHRLVEAMTEKDHVLAVAVLDEREGNQKTLVADVILDATELGDLLALAGIEHVVGAESQEQTGEPSALEGSPDPRWQNPFTHVFAMDYRPGEEHVIARPPEYDFWRARTDPQTGKPRLHVEDLFGFERTHAGRKIERPAGYRLSTWAMRRAVCRGNFLPGAFDSDISMGIWLQNAYDLGPLTGVAADEQARHLARARQLSLSLVYWLQTEAPNPERGMKGFPGLRLRGDVFGTEDGLAPYPYVREARRIRAEFTVVEQHFRRDLAATRDGPVEYADSVGLSGYRVDIARTGASGLPLAQENHGKHWRQQIPLGALLPVRVENVLPACKNLGVTSVMNGAFRVHPTEWNVGESAGTLAAFALERKLALRQVRANRTHLQEFQRELRRMGVELNWPGNDFARSYFSQISVERPDWYYGEAWRL